MFVRKSVQFQEMQGNLRKTKGNLWLFKTTQGNLREPLGKPKEVLERDGKWGYLKQTKEKSKETYRNLRKPKEEFWFGLARAPRGNQDIRGGT